MALISPQEKISAVTVPPIIPPTTQTTLRVSLHFTAQPVMYFQSVVKISLPIVDSNEKIIGHWLSIPAMEFITDEITNIDKEWNEGE